MQKFSSIKNKKLRHFGIATIMLVAIVSGASDANAATITGSFNLRGSGGPQDRPNFLLSNTSDAGVDITHFNMTIGDENYNFDRFYTDSNVGYSTPSTPAGGSAPTFNLDTDNGGLNYTEVDIDYNGFAAGTASSFRIEFDPNSGDATVNPRTILFNNGLSIANSVITILFMYNGTEGKIEYTMPDVTGSGATASVYNFSSSIEFQVSAVSAVPLPASLPLFGAGLAVLGLASWRRKKKTAA